METLLDHELLSLVFRVRHDVFEHHCDHVVLYVAVHIVAQSFELRNLILVVVVVENLLEDILVHRIEIVLYHEEILVNEVVEVLSYFLVEPEKMTPDKDACKTLKSHVKFLHRILAQWFDEIHYVCSAALFPEQ